MAMVDTFTRHEIADDLGERLIRTRRRVEFVRAWLNEIDAELSKIGATIDGM